MCACALVSFQDHKLLHWVWERDWHMQFQRARVSSSYIACSGTANASGRPEGAIDKYVGKTLLSTVSCTAGFSAFCFTIELHVHDVQALPAYRPSHPCLDSIQAVTSMPWQLTWKIYSKLLKSKNEGLYQRVIKARWIKACLVSSKRYGITITKLLYSTVSC